ncbi:XRE family transcriptional regulator [Ruegeria sp. 2205SS24-7]|uniref:XRE family transcriptional regulator n=1 Tax=Ruegeria discodermiae TaxID=3064389 RepID=UPI00274036BF|nr:XRE family transcriptional regulator [Ruegeria sp. 2205SS24-7]MDP5218548.1 XRE family transcriptional regulator [Ruegeria sp. 2205SS24-7]
MAKKTDTESEVGQTLQRLRLERDLTLADLAGQAQLSTAMISRIENGHVSPSLGTLQSLADALDVSLMALFTHSEHTADVHHVKAGEGLRSRRITQGHAHDYMLLGKHGGPGGSFQSARICIFREDSENLPRYQHEGHVFIYMIAGDATYRCGTEDFAMSAGDTLSFDAMLQHGFREILSDMIEIITVSTRPQ